MERPKAKKQPVEMSVKDESSFMIGRGIPRGKVRSAGGSELAIRNSRGATHNAGSLTGNPIILGGSGVINH